MGDMRFSGSRVTLRSLQERDLESVLAILLEPEIAPWWWDYDAKRLHADTLEDPDTTALVVEMAEDADDDGEPVGLVLLGEESDPYYKSASIDIALATSSLGKGLGTEVLRTVARYLFEERGHHRITIDPAVPNVRAIGAYKKVGFKPVGVLRAHELGPDGWHDNLLLDMLEGDLS